MTYPFVAEGEWLRPPADELFGFQCCDCGLVHDLEFDIDEDGRVIFRAFRNNRATGQVRRWRKSDR